MKDKEILDFTMSLGIFMLKHGAETYRVEDTTKRILTFYNFNEISIFAIPTSVFITANGTTHFKRVVAENIDLETIATMNQLSRDLISGQIDFQEAKSMLEVASKEIPTFSSKVHVLGSGMAGGFFSLLFHGNTMDFLLSYIITCIIVVIADYLTSKHVNFFIKNIIAGFFAGLFSILATHIFAGKFAVTLDIIIIGPIMALVPGVAFTNGMRDIIYGDLVSGSSKITEAIFVSIGIAFGVGAIINLRYLLGI